MDWACFQLDVNRSRPIATLGFLENIQGSKTTLMKKVSKRISVETVKMAKIKGIKSTGGIRAESGVSF